MHKFLPLLFIIFSNGLWAQTIPTDRTVNWSLAGHQGDFLEPQNVIDFVLAGGDSTGIVANDILIQSIISDNSDTPTTIYFGNGNFLFQQPIELSSNFILKGINNDLTKLSFDLSSPNDAITAEGTQSTDSLFVSQSAMKDGNRIPVNAIENFQVDDFIYLIDDDSEKITSSWGLHSTGQICRITEIAQDTIYFQHELRRDFLLNNQPVAIKLNLIENVGIENLSIERLDQTDTQTSNINFEQSYNCWIKCVESIRCNFAHFEARKSSHLEITGCFLDDAFDHGGGGKAYGVMLHFGTGESLIYNNTFNHLRHSMILQAGANGNVLSYNYSIDPFWSTATLPSNSAGDAVLHGNYPYANLFEGNIIQQIVIDNSHGINGTNNTFFRNRAELYGLFMNNSPASDGQNFVGNEITNEGGFLGLYLLEGGNHFEFGNNQTGNIIPAGSTDLTQNSLYLDQSPDYFLTQSNWPPIGNINSFNQFSIEAKDRFMEGQLTPCSAIVSGLVPPNLREEIQLYPNPSSNLLFVDSGKIDYDEILVRNLLGNIVLKSTQPQFDISILEDGIYFVELKLKNNTVVISTFVKL